MEIAREGEEEGGRCTGSGRDVAEGGALLARTDRDEGRENDDQLRTFQRQFVEPRGKTL